MLSEEKAALIIQTAWEKYWWKTPVDRFISRSMRNRFEKMLSVEN